MATCATHPTLASSATCRIDARRACGCVQPFTYSIKPAIRRPIVEFKHRNSIPNRHLQQTRVHATAVAEVAQLGEQVAEGLGVLGIGAAGLLFALWNTEKGSKAAVEQELQDTKEQAVALQQQVQQAQQRLQQEKEALKEAESWKPRLDDAQKELFKLERALEMKDAQLATFMNTAHRQIKSLEDTVKELQKF